MQVRLVGRYTNVPVKSEKDSHKDALWEQYLKPKEASEKIEQDFKEILEFDPNFELPIVSPYSRLEEKAARRRSISKKILTAKIKRNGKTLKSGYRWVPTV